MNSFRSWAIFSISLSISIFATLISLATFGQETDGKAAHSPRVVATVQHLTRVKILESNNVSLRPGSVYDNATYFESLLEFPRPGFNYEFLDSGLGAADPLYPMFQKGSQGSYVQLAHAAMSEQSRHIDHFTSLDTSDGCRVDGAYLLRGIDEYPATAFATERSEGYQMIVTRLEYYTRLRPDVQCGRHRSNEPDPNFDPKKFLQDHHNAMSLADFPEKDVARFEAKLSAIRHIEETMYPVRARFDLNNLNGNSLYYYPDGHTFDYGIDTPRPQAGLRYFKLPRQMVLPASAEIQQAFSLDRLLSADEYAKLLAFWNGEPTTGYRTEDEPGRDALRLQDVTPVNFYTSGLTTESIKNVSQDVSNPRNFKMVAVVIKPHEQQEDVQFSGQRTVPQIRFVFQLMNPRNPAEPYEQLFLHLKWDVIDRLADEATRKGQIDYFLKRVDQVSRGKGVDGEADLRGFISEFTQARPVESVAFGSSLTGIWIFGSLGREQSPARQLQAVRIIRDGVDVGYYSSAYDNDIFRDAIKSSAGARKVELQKHMDDVTMQFFRDPRRQDPHALNFNRITCAQCHQTSGRDGVHMSFNDRVDKRNRAPIIVSEYFFHDADLQLRQGADTLETSANAGE